MRSSTLKLCFLDNVVLPANGQEWHDSVVRNAVRLRNPSFVVLQKQILFPYYYRNTSCFL